MSVFFCDSDCELWYDKVKELGIKVIGMPYTISGVTKDYDMGEHTDFKAYFDQIRHGEMPTTQALNPYDYQQYFEPYLKDGQDILYVHFSHNLSGTFNYMATAIDELKQKYPNRKITTVDTLSICIGAGIIVYEAAKMHNAGSSDEEVVKWVEDNRQNYAEWFVVDDLNHLKRGGRISGATAFIGSVLGIKPILKCNAEGKIVSVDKSIGKKTAMRKIVNIVATTGLDVKKYPIIIVDADDKDDADFMERELKNKLGSDLEIWRQPVGPVIGCHCGPSTIGIIFHAKQR